MSNHQWNMADNETELLTSPSTREARQKDPKIVIGPSLPLWVFPALIDNLSARLPTAPGERLGSFCTEYNLPNHGRYPPRNTRGFPYSTRLLQYQAAWDATVACAKVSGWAARCPERHFSPSKFGSSQNIKSTETRNKNVGEWGAE